MEPAITENVELGVWIGRAQAFGLLANKCSAAQAECLKNIRDTGAYQALGVTWDEFGPLYAGASRPTIDSLIRHLEEFGRTYFDLSAIVRISPESYRRLAEKIHGQSIRIGDEMVPIVPENAARIRAAVKRLRAEAVRAAHESRALNADTNVLMMRLETCFQRMHDLATDPMLIQSEADALGDILAYFGNQARRIERALATTVRVNTR